MTQRIIQLHRILKNTGSFYLHCDHTANHYLKLVLDEIFGKNNFRNEIAWHYSGWNAKLKNSFNKRYDTILFYSKSANFTFNSYAESWQTEEEYIQVRKQKLLIDKDGRKYVMSDGGNGKRIKRFLDEAMKYGKPICDIWMIDKINNSSKEATGYPTQKPLALLRRIIQASSNEGDIVLDPFCGCATTCVAAQQLGRKWIGIDIEKQAADLLVERLSDDAGLFKNFVHTTIIPQRTDLTIEPITPSIKQRLFTQQKAHCNACDIELPIHQFEVDHIIPKSKGGGDYYENYQLLCGSCNKIKGDRPMEYLRLKIQTREKHLKEKISFGE